MFAGIQSRTGPDELRRSTAKISKFNNLRKELLEALNDFIEESMDDIG